MYEIIVRPQARAELKALRPFEQRKIVDAVEQKLSHEPAAPDRNRKMLEGIAPGFEHDPPIWELRVGEYRVFYDVREETRTVYVRAVRRKPPHRTTQEVIQ